MPGPSRLRRAAFALLVSLIAMVGVTVLAPLVHPVAYRLVCSVQGSKLVAMGDVVYAGHPSGHEDHEAHCPLCMPAGVPPAFVAWEFAPVQPLVHVRQSVPPARRASLVGAPLPARGPPVRS